MNAEAKRKESLIVEALRAMDLHAGEQAGAFPEAVALADEIERHGLYEAVWG